MKAVPGGRFCNACSQVVTDFTRMTDAQLIDWMLTYKAGCGSFRPDQLNRQLIAPVVSKAPSGMKWLLSLLVMTGCIRDEGRREAVKMQHTSGIMMIDQRLIVDSPMIVGEIAPPDIDTAVRVPPKEETPHVLPEIQTIVQGGIAWDPEPMIERNDSSFSVMTGEIAVDDKGRTGMNFAGEPGPAQPVRRSFWKRLFGRR